VGDSINWVVLCFGSSFRKISLHIQGSGLRIVGVKWLPAAELTQKWHLGAHSRTKDDDCECVAKLTSLAHTILAITHTHTHPASDQSVMTRPEAPTCHCIQSTLTCPPKDVSHFSAVCGDGRVHSSLAFFRPLNAAQTLARWP